LKIITVLGGYGIFGRRVSSALAAVEGAAVRVVGRDPQAGLPFAASIRSEFRRADLNDGDSLRQAIAGSFLVIHAAGPFQGKDYRVAGMCLDHGAHYLDLADSRQFVSGIGVLHDAAQRRGLFVSSGASSVPAITHDLGVEAGVPVDRGN
jgi:saccharopine dehydrogenase-like NADP-dependent oxidoreductase